MWSLPSPSSDAVTPGSVWTVEIHWEDPAAPVTAAGGQFWAEYYPEETWPGGKDCPFPGANTSNYDVHRAHGVNCFFLDHDPNTVGLQREKGAA